MSLMTIFITPKDFRREHIATIQWNAIKSWTMLDDVDVVLIGDDEGVEEFSAEMGVRYVKDVKRNASGTPLLSDIFRIARETSDSPLLAYVNADIILFPDFVERARQAAAREKAFLLVGQRWDLDIQEKLDFSGDYESRIRADMKARARRHPAGGSDYFVFPREIFTEIPEFAIGRSGWDNWMFYEARYRGWKLIDCSNVIDIIHQDHDYAHLPGGLSHYRQAESAENIKAAGGMRNIFTLLDCDAEMRSDGSIGKPKMTKKKMLREIEIFPQITLKSKILSDLVFALYHPKKAYGALRNRGKA